MIIVNCLRIRYLYKSFNNTACLPQPNFLKFSTLSIWNSTIYKKLSLWRDVHVALSPFTYIKKNLTWWWYNMIQNFLDTILFPIRYPLVSVPTRSYPYLQWASLTVHKQHNPDKPSRLVISTGTWYNTKYWYWIGKSTVSNKNCNELLISDRNVHFNVPVSDHFKISHL